MRRAIYVWLLLLTGCASSGESVLDRAKDRCADRDGRWTPSGCELRILRSAHESTWVDVLGTRLPGRLETMPRSTDIWAVPPKRLPVHNTYRASEKETTERLGVRHAPGTRVLRPNPTGKGIYPGVTTYSGRKEAAHAGLGHTLNTQVAGLAHQTRTVSVLTGASMRGFYRPVSSPASLGVLV